VRHAVTRTFIERPADLPGWAHRLIPASKRRYLEGLKRVDATPFGRPVVADVLGRSLSIGGRERIDFATGCYLGLDFDVAEADVDAARRWGLRNGWSRASGTLPLGRELEAELADQLGFEACRIGASISLINYSVFYSLKHLFPVALVDADAHMTMVRGVRAAYGRGRDVLTFPNNDVPALEAMLRGLPADLPKLVVVDGVYSMRGVRAPLRAILDLCHAHGATCYIDDAHGVGVLGDRGLGVAETLTAADRDRTLLVGGFSKAASNPVGFIAFPQRVWYGVDAADFLTFCGPPSNFHAAVALRHLRAFHTPAYAALRRRVRTASLRLHAVCAAASIATMSEPGMPMLSVRIQGPAMEAIVAELDRRGIFAKIAIFPVARAGSEAVRFSITAMHTDAQLDALASALRAVAPMCVRTAELAVVRSLGRGVQHAHG
jgi:7-keto-8-aminopelargonate synthetase-like enzyme